MTAEEKKKAYMNNEELGSEEVEKITQLISDFKRALEVAYLLPEGKELLNTNAEEFKSKYGLPNVDTYALRLFFGDEPVDWSTLSEDEVLDAMPYQLFRYRQFCINKVARRDNLLKVENVPLDPKMAKWRERQINRAKGFSGKAYSSNVQINLALELQDGCSVGCPFCGAGAKKLQKIYRYTDENAELFRNVIKAAHEEIGESAGKGCMYLATEPLDNPDYELFLADYRKEFNTLPQITTAVATRDVERMHKLLEPLRDEALGYYRFSIKSIKEAEDVLREFSPRELIRVELLPQYEEAPGFQGFAKAGKNRAADKTSTSDPEMATDRLYGVEPVKEIENEKGVCITDQAEEKVLVATICCISGFIVNMARKDIRLVTPYPADDEHPDGEVEVARRHFESAEEFRDIIRELIATYMSNQLPSDVVLKPYDYFFIKKLPDKGECILTNAGYYLALDNQFDGFEDTAKLLFEGKYTKKEIAYKLSIEKGIAPFETYFCLGVFYKNGIINEYDFELTK